jgi:hypothetical protein
MMNSVRPGNNKQSNRFGERPDYNKAALELINKRINELERQSSYFCFFSRKNEKIRILLKIKESLENNYCLPIYTINDLDKINLKDREIKYLEKGLFSHKTKDTMREVFHELQKIDSDYYVYKPITYDLVKILKDNQHIEIEKTTRIFMQKMEFLHSKVIIDSDKLKPTINRIAICFKEAIKDETIVFKKFIETFLQRLEKTQQNISKANRKDSDVFVMSFINFYAGRKVNKYYRTI